MTNAEKIIRETAPSQIIKNGEDAKGIYGKRHILVKYDKGQDLFNIHAFTMKGVEMTNEVTINSLFIEQLKEAIEEAK